MGANGLAGDAKVADPANMAALGWKTLAGGGITALHVERETALPTYVGTRAWVTGDGPKVIFADAVRWLRDRDVLAVR